MQEAGKDSSPIHTDIVYTSKLINMYKQGVLAGVPFFDEIFKQLGCSWVDYITSEGPKRGCTEIISCTHDLKTASSGTSKKETLSILLKKILKSK